MKSIKFRKLMSGNSAIVIKNGIIDQKAMRKVRLTVIDLVELLRGQGVFKIEDVAYAVLEVNGSLSVLQKSQFMPAEKQDIKDLKIKKETLPLPVISDGKIIKDALISLDCDQNEIMRRISPTKVEDVFLLTLDREGKIKVIMKEPKK